MLESWFNTMRFSPNDYSFDNRLLGMTLLVTTDNYYERMLKLGGIWYAVSEPLALGDIVTVDKVTGNVVTVQKCQPTVGQRSKAND